MIRTIACLIFGAVAAAGVFLFATRKTHDTAWWENECEREDLVARLEICKLRVGNEARLSQAPLVEAALAENAEREIKIAGLKSRAEALKSSIQKTEAEWSGRHENWVRESRARSIGREWDSFVLADGRTFQQAKVVAVNDGGVSLRHLHGSATVRFADLTEDHRILFGMDGDSAAEAEAAERRLAANYHEWVEDGLETARFQQALKRAVKGSPKSPPKSVPRKSARPTGVWLPVASSPATKDFSLKIGQLGEVRKLDTSRRVYTRPLRNSVYYYPYRYGGGVYSPGYQNGCSTGWTFVPRPLSPRNDPATP